MKKLLALLLVLTMIFAFAACTLFSGDDNGDGNDGGNNDGGNNDGGDDSGINNQIPEGGIDLPLVDIEPDGIE